MSPPLILLVEDSPEDVLFFKKALAQAGLKCDLEVVNDGMQAVDRLSACDAAQLADPAPCPTHVVLDLKMPRMSGIEVLAWIRAHRTFRKLPAIILTSSQVASDLNKAQTLGVDAFLVKPVTFKGLVDIVGIIGERWKIPMGAG